MTVSDVICFLMGGSFQLVVGLFSVAVERLSHRADGDVMLEIDWADAAFLLPIGPSAI